MTGDGIKMGMTPPHPCPFIQVAAGARQGPDDRAPSADPKNGDDSELREIFFDRPPGIASPFMSRRERT